MKKLKALLPLLLVIAALFTAGCIGGNTGSGLPDTDDDNRTGTNEIGDEDNQPGFETNMGGDANTDTGTGSDQTTGTDTTGTTDTGTGDTTGTGADTDTGEAGDTETSTNTSGNASLEEENCNNGVCGTPHTLSDYQEGETITVED